MLACLSSCALQVAPKSNRLIEGSKANKMIKDSAIGFLILGLFSLAYFGLLLLVVVKPLLDDDHPFTFWLPDATNLGLIVPSIGLVLLISIVSGFVFYQASTSH